MGLWGQPPAEYDQFVTLQFVCKGDSAGYKAMIKDHKLSSSFSLSPSFPSLSPPSLPPLPPSVLLRRSS